MEKTIYVVDDILLFNPNLEGKKTVIYGKQADFSKYEEIIFYTYDVNNIIFPVKKIGSLHLQNLNKKLYLEDVSGYQIKVNALFLLNITIQYGVDILFKSKLLQNTENEVERLFKDTKNVNLNKGRTPIYIKTTHAFGTTTGGAVAHSTGVINSLRNVYQSPLIFTTDCLGEEVADLPVQKMSMRRYKDFSELMLLYFNINGFSLISKQIRNIKKSFIYQRYSMDNFIGVRLSTKHRIPLVLEFNGSEVWLNKNWASGLKYPKIAGMIEKLNLNKADLIVCVSQVLKDQLVDRGIPANKILVNYNGVDVKKYNPSVKADWVIDKYNLSNQTVIGFVGSFDMFHGVENLAKAFCALLNQYPGYKEKVKLILIGDGKVREKVEKILRGYHVNDNCIFTGAIDFKDVPAHLSACDILVAPHVPNKDSSPFFGSPTKLFEYMAMGKGIVASDLNQIGEILEDQETALLVQPNSIEELTKAMKQLVDDKKLCETLGRNARKVVEENYTWDKHVEHIIDALHKIYE